MDIYFQPWIWEKERPLFETAPLVDIGPRFPFYEDYMANAGGLTSPEDLRVPQFGDLTVLKGLWAEVGNFTNHQDVFRQLDWSSITLTANPFISSII